MAMVRVLILHEERLFREALRALLHGRNGLQVVADAADALTAPSLIEEARPDVVVVDLASAAQAVGLARRPPLVAVVGEQERARALALGIGAVVSRGDGPEDAFAAIRAAAPAFRQIDGDPSLAGVLEIRPRPDPLRALTAREREIFTLVIRGFSTAAIARQLEVSPRTVETHRAHLSRKLGAHSAADLVRYAARNGLLTAQAC